MILCFLKEKFEHTKGVIRNRKSIDRQYNGQKKKDKGTNNDLQNTNQKTKEIVLFWLFSNIFCQF
jgi:hypothetical protein